MIFVSIASYRDPQLFPTVEDLFLNAKEPNKLRVVICEQIAPEDKCADFSNFKYKNNIKVITIPHSQVPGVCYIRNLIQKYYSGEDYYLQLDSHHRFVKNWDEICINMLTELKKESDKPLLTAYLPSFNPETDERLNEVWQLNYDRFIPEGIPFTIPSKMEDISHPRKSAFFSAHFVFTDGKYVQDVKYERLVMFHSEEPLMAVRSFCAGYDMYNPNRIIAWHEYTRKGRSKIWDDFDSWIKRNEESHKYAREKLGIGCERKIFTDKYRIKEDRSLEEYEQFAGIRFRDRAVTRHAIDKLEPPNTSNEFKPHFRHCINIHRDNFKYDNYLFWALILHDKEGKELYRKDFQEYEVKGYLNSVLSKKKHEQFLDIWVETFLREYPSKWIIWTYTNEWTDERYEEKLSYDA